MHLNLLKYIKNQTHKIFFPFCLRSFRVILLSNLLGQVNTDYKIGDAPHIYSFNSTGSMLWGRYAKKSENTLYMNQWFRLNGYRLADVQSVKLVFKYEGIRRSEDLDEASGRFSVVTCLTVA